MGIESYVNQTIGKTLWYSSNTEYINGKLQLRFWYSSDRNLAYTRLIKSGSFKPRKIGKFIIRFDPLYK